MPRYPIVVIKENERIIAGNMITKSLGEYGAVLKAQSDSNLDFVFWMMCLIILIQAVLL